MQAPTERFSLDQITQACELTFLYLSVLGVSNNFHCAEFKNDKRFAFSQGFVRFVQGHTVSHKLSGSDLRRRERLEGARPIYNFQAHIFKKKIRDLETLIPHKSVDDVTYIFVTNKSKLFTKLCLQRFF